MIEIEYLWFNLTQFEEFGVEDHERFDPGHFAKNVKNNFQNFSASHAKVKTMNTETNTIEDVSRPFACLKESLISWLLACMMHQNVDERKSLSFCWYL